MKATTKQLLATLPLSKTDAARLILETIEEMQELHHAAAQGKAALMTALRRVMREGIAGIRAQEKTVSFQEAAQRSLMHRERAGRRPTTLRDLRYFIRRLLRVPGLADRPLRAMVTPECHHILEQAFAASKHSFRKGRAILHSIFAYGIKQGWCSENPVSSVDVPNIEEKEIIPLSLQECRKLVEVAKTQRFRDCLPALGLMLFAGVRPGEITRLRWTDIHCEEGILSITPLQSKTGGARRIELCSSLKRLLRKHRNSAASRTLSICPPLWSKRWQRIRQIAGLSTPQRRWIPDVLRHTYASYHALTYHNLPALQLQLGHRDARLLLTRYLNLRGLRRADARPFWQLLR